MKYIKLFEEIDFDDWDYEEFEEEEDLYSNIYVFYHPRNDGSYFLGSLVGDKMHILFYDLDLGKLRFNDFVFFEIDKLIKGDKYKEITENMNISYVRNRSSHIDKLKNICDKIRVDIENIKYY